MTIFSYLQCESVEERRAIIREQDRAYEESLYIDQAKVSGHDHVCKFVVHFLGTCFFNVRLRNKLQKQNTNRLVLIVCHYTQGAHFYALLHLNV